MELLITRSGQIRCLYGDAIDLEALGALNVRRASYVEPDTRGRWHADLSPVGGPRLGPFRWRQDALAREAAWLVTHWLLAERF